MKFAPFFSFLSNLLPPNPATSQIKSLGSLPDLVISRTSVFYTFLCFIFCFIFVLFSVFLFFVFVFVFTCSHLFSHLFNNSTRFLFIALALSFLLPIFLFVLIVCFHNFVWFSQFFLPVFSCCRFSLFSLALLRLPHPQLWKMITE